jgi:hypothetical protein
VGRITKRKEVSKWKEEEEQMIFASAFNSSHVPHLSSFNL